MKEKKTDAKCDVVDVDLKQLYALLVATKHTPLTECYLEYYACMLIVSLFVRCFEL
jgi:hypothetical protein